MENNCSHDPREYKDSATGMYHCPECGEMVLAGVEHPSDISDEEMEEYFRTHPEIPNGNYRNCDDDEECPV